MIICRKNKNEYRVEVPKKIGQDLDISAIVKWCKNSFGPEKKKWTKNYSKETAWRVGWIVPKLSKEVDVLYYFYFNRPQDAQYFALAWAG